MESEAYSPDAYLRKFLNLGDALADRIEGLERPPSVNGVRWADVLWYRDTVTIELLSKSPWRFGIAARIPQSNGKRLEITFSADKSLEAMCNEAERRFFTKLDQALDRAINEARA